MREISVRSESVDVFDALLFTTLEMIPSKEVGNVVCVVIGRVGMTSPSGLGKNSFPLSDRERLLEVVIGVLSGKLTSMCLPVKVLSADCESDTELLLPGVDSRLRNESVDIDEMLDSCRAASDSRFLCSAEIFTLGSLDDFSGVESGVALSAGMGLNAGIVLMLASFFNFL